MSSNPYLIKKLVQQYAVLNIKTESSLELIQEQLEDQSLYKKIVKKFIMLPQIFIVVVLVQLLIHNLLIYSNLQIFNYKD